MYGHRLVFLRRKYMILTFYLIRARPQGSFFHRFVLTLTFASSVFLCSLFSDELSIVKSEKKSKIDSEKIFVLSTLL